MRTDDISFGLIVVGVSTRIAPTKCLIDILLIRNKQKPSLKWTNLSIKYHLVARHKKHCIRTKLFRSSREKIRFIGQVGGRGELGKTNIFLPIKLSAFVQIKMEIIFPDSEPLVRLSARTLDLPSNYHQTVNSVLTSWLLYLKWSDMHAQFKIMDMIEPWPLPGCLFYCGLLYSLSLIVTTYEVMVGLFIGLTRKSFLHSAKTPHTEPFFHNENFPFASSNTLIGLTGSPQLHVILDRMTTVLPTTPYMWFLLGEITD